MADPILTRDLCIETLALSEQQLIARVVDLEADVASYRAVAVAGINHAHDLQLENRRLRQQLEHLRAEFRQLRSQVFTSKDLVDERAA